MKFTKMHGCGNDYIYVNCFKEKVDRPGELAEFLSDRHFGIGSDGLILIKESKNADFMMDMYNADGSRAQMCGNGIRCVAKYVYDYGLTDSTQISIETMAGIKYLDLTLKNGKVEKVMVDMGAPVTNSKLIPVDFDKDMVIDEDILVHGEQYKMTCISMGNPHAVIFTDNINNIDIEKIGPGFEKHELFPARINTEFVQIVDRKNINMRVWERGTGETLACGTGACASVVACVLNGKTEDEVTVHLLGGDLQIKYDRLQNTVFMTGTATKVFDGEIDI